MPVVELCILPISAIKPDKKFMAMFIGFLDGDGYFDIGVQKQYNKNADNKYQPKSTIRIRLGTNLQINDKNLLEFIVKKLGVGKIDYSKSKNQCRLKINFL